MTESQLHHYILERLEELHKGKHLQDAQSKGQLSFGMEQERFGHLPSWPRLVQKKKKLLRLFWAGGFLLSLVIVGSCYDLPGRFSSDWGKALASWLAVSAVSTLFYVALNYLWLFFHFRQADQEVRKLIYEDLLHRLKQPTS